MLLGAKFMAGDSSAQNTRIVTNPLHWAMCTNSHFVYILICSESKRFGSATLHYCSCDLPKFNNERELYPVLYCILLE